MWNPRRVSYQMALVSPSLSRDDNSNPKAVHVWYRSDVAWLTESSYGCSGCLIKVLSLHVILLCPCMFWPSPAGPWLITVSSLVRSTEKGVAQSESYGPRACMLWLVRSTEKGVAQSESYGPRACMLSLGQFSKYWCGAPGETTACR